MKKLNQLFLIPAGICDFCLSACNKACHYYQHACSGMDQKFGVVRSEYSPIHS